MGSCLCTSHKELQGGQLYPMGELQSCSEGQPINKGIHQPYNGGFADKKNGSGYNIGELATSSLQGLVATIKEHITKPTAMAQGRVAHLIEWKGWGGDRGGGDSWCGWNQPGGVGAALHEDQQLYSHLTDEIKEARFAAGVAEQFALAEAAMNVWSPHVISDQPSTAETVALHGAEGLYLSQFLLDGGSVGVPQHLYSVHVEPSPDAQSLMLQLPNPRTQSSSPGSPRQQETQPPSRGSRDLRTPQTDDAVHADSASLSEDEVFYN
ncbi:protein FAM131C [Engraulis encrasicolus]|uniref:protein FAM131C n=1 Tax=Engraulis encrasicolus TaxID=184585 RepID=UPI002FD517B0